MTSQDPSVLDEGTILPEVTEDTVAQKRSVWGALQSAVDHAVAETPMDLNSPFWRDSSVSLEVPANSVAFLQAMFDALSSPIAILDQHGLIVATNEAWHQRADDPLRYPALGTNYLQCCDEHTEEMPDARRIGESIREVLAGERHQFQLEYVTHSLELRRWSHMQVNRFTMGELAYGVVMHEDVTRCKQVEEALQFSEEYYRALCEHASDLILVLNAGGTILYPSPSVERILGFPCEAFKHRNCFDWIHGDDMPDLLARFAALLQCPNEPCSLEFRFWHASGEWRTLEGTAQNLLSHRSVGGIVLNLRDISDRKSVEQRLRYSEAKNGAMLEAIPDLMFRIREDGQVLDLRHGKLPEPSAFQYISPRQSHYEIDSIHDLMSCVQEHVQEVLNTRKNLMFECQLSLDSQVFVYEVRLVCCGAHEVLSMVRDVTEQTLIQTKLLQAERMAELGTLTASLGHEINNPLTYVIGHLEEICERMEDSPRFASEEDQELLELASEALDGAQRVRFIARDLKTYAHSNEEVGAVDVHVALQRALQLTTNEIRHCALLDKDLGEDIPPVQASQARLEQIFVNLLLNAAHALPEDNKSRNVIHIRTTHKPCGRVEVAISDNGRGIPADQLEKIFQPFFTTKPLNQGTGLGLFVCHNIITSLGGSLRVRSQVGEGTTFLVELQAAEVVQDQPTRDDLLPVEPPAPLQLMEIQRDTLVQRIPDEIMQLVERDGLRERLLDNASSDNAFDEDGSTITSERPAPQAFSALQQTPLLGERSLPEGEFPLPEAAFFTEDKILQDRTGALGKSDWTAVTEPGTSLEDLLENADTIGLEELEQPGESTVIEPPDAASSPPAEPSGGSSAPPVNSSSPQQPTSPPPEDAKPSAHDLPRRLSTPVNILPQPLKPPASVRSQSMDSSTHSLPQRVDSSAGVRSQRSESAAAPSSIIHEQPPSPTSLRVLIVDDEPRVARSLCRILRDCDATLVHGGKEALVRCENESFDLILCDILMPEVTGIDVYEKLCERDAGIHDRFVFMTGGAFTETSQAFLQKTDRPVLEKPFERKKVRKLLEHTLHRAEAVMQ